MCVQQNSNDAPKGIGKLYDSIHTFRYLGMDRGSPKLLIISSSMEEQAEEEEEDAGDVEPTMQELIVRFFTELPQRISEVRKHLWSKFSGMWGRVRNRKVRDVNQSEEEIEEGRRAEADEDHLSKSPTEDHSGTKLGRTTPKDNQTRKSSLTKTSRLQSIVWSDHSSSAQKEHSIIKEEPEPMTVDSVSAKKDNMTHLLVREDTLVAYTSLPAPQPPSPSASNASSQNPILQPASESAPGLRTEDDENETPILRHDTS